MLTLNQEAKLSQMSWRENFSTFLARGLQGWRFKVQAMKTGIPSWEAVTCFRTPSARAGRMGSDRHLTQHWSTYMKIKARPVRKSKRTENVYLWSIVRWLRDILSRISTRLWIMFASGKCSWHKGEKPKRTRKVSPCRDNPWIALKNLKSTER
jgi:hypothetical protein